MTEQHWFRTRCNGRCWTPCSWQGWIVSCITLFLVLLVALDYWIFRRPLFALLELAFVLGLFIALCRATSDEVQQEKAKSTGKR